MKKLMILLSFSSLVSLKAQQNPGVRPSNIVSPQINNDNTVTFRLKADKAQNAVVRGDWEANGGIGKMSRDTGGVWTYITPKLPSDLYMYSFLVDSVGIIDPQNVFTYRDVANNYNIFIVNNGNGDNYSVNDVPHGSVSKIWYPSIQYKTERRLTVYTPPNYENSKSKYPVLYLMHGSGGDEDTWLTLGRVAYIMDNLIDQGKIVPMLVVMPNGNESKQAAPGETKENFSYLPTMSQFLPNFADGSYERAFPEIVKFIDTHYRTKAQKGQRAIAGYSMGGFHSLSLSANHPDLFDYIGLFSPGTPVGRPTLANVPELQNFESKYTTQKAKGFKLYWIAIGNKDFLYDYVQKQIKIFDKLNFKYTYVESERGHIWSNWRNYMLQFTPLLFRK